MEKFIDIYNNGNLNFIDDYPTYQQNQDIFRAADIHILQMVNFYMLLIVDRKKIQ